MNEDKKTPAMLVAEANALLREIAAKYRTTGDPPVMHEAIRFENALSYIMMQVQIVPDPYDDWLFAPQGASA